MVSFQTFTKFIDNTSHYYFSVTNLALPKISLNPVDYFDAEAMKIVMGFLLFLRFCEFVCIGKYVDSYRMNGKPPNFKLKLLTVLLQDFKLF